MIRKFFAVILSCALIFQGCTGVIVQRGKIPTEIKREKAHEEKVFFVSKVPSGEYKKAKLSESYKVVQVEKRILATGGKWKLFINDEKVVLRNWGGKGKNKKLYTVWLGPGHVFAAKLLKENGDSRLYKVEFLGRCGNEVEDLFVLESPRIVAITERYRDIDWTPAIWTGIAGLLLGYLFWFSPGGSASVAGGKACAPGAAAVR